MHHSIALTRGSILSNYVDLAQRRGADPGQLLEESSIAMVYVEQPDLYFPFDRYVSLLEHTSEKLNHPFFGLELGLEQGLNLFGPTAFLLTTSNTLGDALANMVRFFSLQSSGSAVSLRRANGRALIVYEIIQPNVLGARQVNEHALGAGLAIFRSLLGPIWSPIDFYLQHDSDGLGIGFRRFLGRNPIFNSEWTGLLFEETDLNRKLSDANPALNDLIQRQLTNTQTSSEQDFERHICLLIRHSMTSGRLELAHIAKMSALSTRTLQRRLGDLGTSFQTLVEKTRRETAVYYLTSTNMQMTQISQLLGYRGLSTFNHAFQRWHNTTPSNWRKK